MYFTIWTLHATLLEIFYLLLLDITFAVSSLLEWTDGLWLTNHIISNHWLSACCFENPYRKYRCIMRHLYKKFGWQQLDCCYLVLKLTTMFCITSSHPFFYRYKKELSAAVEREASLERSKTQLELDWQRRYEDLERLQYEKSEDLVKKLTQARDEVCGVLNWQTFLFWEKSKSILHQEISSMFIFTAFAVICFLHMVLLS